jgi:hypothetical protein
LNYSSNRTPGRLENRQAQFLLTEADYPGVLKSVRLALTVAGKHEVHQFLPAPDLTFDYTFDGTDQHGRSVQGRQRLWWELSYVYDPVYADTDSFGVVPTSGVALTGDSRGTSLP